MGVAFHFYHSNRMQYNWENSYTSKEVNASASEQFSARLQEMQHQIYTIVENQKKLAAKVDAYGALQVTNADVRDDWELMKREQRVLTDHIGRLSQAVMELKTSKRSDALAAAAQIRDQAEEIMSGIRSEMHSMRQERGALVSDTEAKLSTLETNFEAKFSAFREGYDSKINQVKTETEDSLAEIRDELESTLIAVKQDLLFKNDKHSSKYIQSREKVPDTNLNRSVGTPHRLADSPRQSMYFSPERHEGSGRYEKTGKDLSSAPSLKATSIRTVALDNELKLLEEKIKIAQESILKGYDIS